MSTEKNQSQIAEVRDQLSLDYADGKYLSRLTANLGLPRPVFGFDDDTWRAVVKVIALQHKQIRQKFVDVLTELVGPQSTVFSSIAEDVGIGSTTIRVVDSTGFPQQGIVVLDEGLASEETIEYSFIDRTTHTLFLNSETTASHSGRENDPSSAILESVSAGSTSVQVHPSYTLQFTEVLPASVTLGAGTLNEEVTTLTAVDTDSGVLTLASGLVNSHAGVAPSVINGTLSQDYIANAEFIVLNSVKKFPESGLVLLGPSSTKIVATSGTGSSVSYTAGDLSANRHAGSIVVFDGNITASLAGVEARIQSNTDTTITFSGSLPTTPAPGDTFSIRPVVRYTRVVPEDSALQLHQDIADVSLATATTVEFLTETERVGLSSAAVKGVDWDVIQANPRLIEILLPPSIRDVNTVRSASYLHPTEQSLSTTVASNVSAGDTSAILTDVSSWPSVGQLVFDPLGINIEYSGYTKRRIVDTYLAAGSSSTVINVTTGGFTAGAYSGQLVYLENPDGSLAVARPITSNTPSSFTLQDPLSSHELSQLVDGHTQVWVYSLTDVELLTPPEIPHTVGEIVDYHEVVDTAPLQSGDLWAHDFVFPGPYVYDLTSARPNPAVGTTTLNQVLAGPTKVALDAGPLLTALEVENASDFPLGAVSPYNAVVGRGTGNRETITIHDVNLANRASTVIDVAGSSAGDTVIPVASLTGVGVADDFPNARGYRVIIDRDGPNEEVVYVLGTTSTPSDSLLVETTTLAHAAGETVELVNDVLTVDPLDDAHKGSLSLADKLQRYPSLPLVSLASPTVSGGTEAVLTSTSALSNTGKVRIDGYDYAYSKLTSNKIEIVTPGGLKVASTAGTQVFLLRNFATPEKVEVLYDTVEVVSTTGFSASGGKIGINFGSSVISAASDVATAAIAGDTVLSLADTSGFPTSYPFTILVGEGKGTRSERVRVTNNNTTTNQLTVDALRFPHDVGERVTFTAGQQEYVDYTSASGTTLTFSPPIVLKYSHYPSESVLVAENPRIPRLTGYDFPLRIPTDLVFRISFLFDLIRAAGIKVEVIEKL